MGSSHYQPQAEKSQRRDTRVPDRSLVSVADLWRDFRLQPASWINSLLIHIVALAVLVVPFVLSPKLDRVKASNPFVHIYLPASLAALSGPDQQTSGGGGGGDRSPMPASRGKIPEFSMTPLAPPMVKFANSEPLLPVQPKLLGPDELRLPEMAIPCAWRLSRLSKRGSAASWLWPSRYSAPNTYWKLSEAGLC